MISKIRIAFAASFIGMAALAGGSLPVSAAPAAGAPAVAVSEQARNGAAAVEKVHYRGGVRRECAARWGWDTRGFYRCLHRHRHVRPIRNYCKATRHTCADRWGWRTGRYYRCVRNRGC